MTVTVTSKIVYTIRDSNHPSETYDVIGIDGLEKHYENCLGGFVDKMYSESVTCNALKDKQRLFKFLEQNKTQLLPLFELSEIIDELKQSNDE